VNLTDMQRVKKMYPRAFPVRFLNDDVGVHDGEGSWLTMSGAWRGALLNIEAGRLGANEQPATARANNLWLYIRSTGKWEMQRCGSAEIRDYLRAAWQRSGYATAVER
jgi:hypothetical protein